MQLRQTAAGCGHVDLAWPQVPNAPTDDIECVGVGVSLCGCIGDAAHPIVVHRYHLYYINAAGDKTEKVLPGTAKTYTIDNCRGQPLTPGQEVYCNIECVPHILGWLPSAAPT